MIPMYSVCLVALAFTSAAVSPMVERGSFVTTQAAGLFDVKLTPQGERDTANGIALGRMSIDKQFHGDLDAVSKGQMLTSGLESNGSAAYVAIERVTGTLHGRRGSFALMHQGTMTVESQTLTVTVVPESGTGQLVGLSGTMTITFVDKQHHYDFAYSLPENQ